MHIYDVHTYRLIIVQKLEEIACTFLSANVSQNLKHRLTSQRDKMKMY